MLGFCFAWHAKGTIELDRARNKSNHFPKVRGCIVPRVISNAYDMAVNHTLEILNRTSHMQNNLRFCYQFILGCVSFMVGGYLTVTSIIFVFDDTSGNFL